MRSYVTVTAPPDDSDLTTLARVQKELSIDEPDTAEDSILDTRITEASSAIYGYLGRDLASQSLTETFRLENETPEYLSLRNWPVTAIASITEDGSAVPEEQYELDADTGLVYRLDAAGYRYVWIASKAVVVSYTAGYVMPAESARTLPHAIEAAAVKLVCDMHIAAGRDSRIKSENIPGVLQQELWVGSLGENGLLPPDVASMLDPYRRAY